MTLIEKAKQFIYEVQYSCLKKKWDNYTRYAELRVSVIMYHHVTNDLIEDNPQCVCRKEVFFNTIVDSLENNVCFIHATDIASILKEDKTGIFAVITFDDVPQDFYENAYPILKQYNIPFSLFITTGFIDKEGYLNKQQIIELSKDPLCTIGGHTMSHPQLRFSKNLRQELCDSKQQLEELIGKEVDIFAYPYGRPSTVSRRVIREAKRAGYKMAFGTVQSILTNRLSDFFYLPRIVIN